MTLRHILGGGLLALASMSAQGASSALEAVLDRTTSVSGSQVEQTIQGLRDVQTSARTLHKPGYRDISVVFDAGLTTPADRGAEFVAANARVQFMTQNGNFLPGLATPVNGRMYVVEVKNHSGNDCLHLSTATIPREEWVGSLECPNVDGPSSVFLLAGRRYGEHTVEHVYTREDTPDHLLHVWNQIDLNRTQANNEVSSAVLDAADRLKSLAAQVERYYGRRQRAFYGHLTTAFRDMAQVDENSFTFVGPHRRVNYILFPHGILTLPGDTLLEFRGESSVPSQYIELYGTWKADGCFQLDMAMHYWTEYDLHMGTEVRFDTNGTLQPPKLVTVHDFTVPRGTILELVPHDQELRSEHHLGNVSYDANAAQKLYHALRDRFCQQ